MSDRAKSRKNASFWRAMRHLAPYRGLVAASIVCAVFVGLAMTGGLGAMLPILRVLINGDTVQSWIYRATAEKRLGAVLVETPSKAQILTLPDKDSGAAAAMGWSDATILIDPADPPVPGDSEAAAAGRTVRLLKKLATATKPIPIQAGSAAPAMLTLPPVSRHYLWAIAAAEKLPTDPVAAIAAIFGILLSIALVGNGIKFFQEYLSDKAAITAVNDIRRRLYDHVLHIPMDHFGRQACSDLTSRLVQDANNLQDGFKTVLGQSIQEPIKIVMALGLAFLFSWQLTLFILVFAPLLMLMIRKFGKKMRRASRSALESSASMLGQLEGTLIGIRVVKAAGAERFERRRYSRIMTGLVKQQLHMSRIDAYSEPIMETLTMLMAGVVIIFAAYLVLHVHTLKPLNFLMVMASLAALGESLRRVSKVSNALQRSNAAAARIFETLDVPAETRDRTTTRHAIDLKTLAKEIVFENVAFSYANATSPAIDGISLTVPRGQCVAIVGRNGSGKTTLLALLPRFYDPQSGRVLIDGLDVRLATLRSLRKLISIVTQDSVIFPGTIADNIAYGNPLASRAAIESAARRAFAHDFIMEKTNGYDTVLGEMGGQLSGGQRQRLCIARAILRESPILILDEATSQVDAESEHLIQKAIEDLMRQRTTFVIAHRFSTIMAADRVIVLERGQIVGQGRHDQLLATCPTYVQLYERQLGPMAATNPVG